MMTNAQQNFASSHGELMALLPWYVNKSLQGQELLAVEKHLSSCLLCKRELIQLEKLAQAVALDNSFDSAEKASFARLKHRLHAGQPDQHQHHTPQNGQIVPLATKAKTAKVNNARVNKWYSHPIWAIAATVLLALLVPFNASQNQFGALNQFKTLSSGEIEHSNPNEIRVVFAEKIDDQKRRAILERIHGQIVAEPTGQGVYTIQLAKAVSPDQLLDVVNLLRKDDNVIFAEPAYTFLSSTTKEDKP